MTAAKKKNDLPQKCPVWPKENLWERLHNCRVMLLIHGCLSDAESTKVKVRIKRKTGE